MKPATNETQYKRRAPFTTTCALTPVEKTFHSPKQRSLSRMFDTFLVDADSSTEFFVESSLAIGPLHEEPKRRFSGDNNYGYETMDVSLNDDGCVGLSTSVGAIDCSFGREEETPRTKRRRLMKRRNSQTPAMLVASSTTVFLASGGFSDTVERGLVIDVDEALNMSLMSLTSTEASETTGHGDSGDLAGMYDSQCWSKGIELAEEMVKHVQQRGH